MHNAPYAFSIIESARGRALLDSIRYARQSGTVPTAQTPGEVEIARLQRSLMHDRLTDRSDAAGFGATRSGVHAIESRRICQAAEGDGPGPKAPVTVAALQAQFRPRENLVEYVLDEKGSYAIEISRTGLKIQNLPARAQISNASRAFVTAIARTGRFPVQRTGTLQADHRACHQPERGVAHCRARRSAPSDSLQRTGESRRRIPQQRSDAVCCAVSDDLLHVEQNTEAGRCPEAIPGRCVQSAGSPIGAVGSAATRGISDLRAREV